MRSTAVLKMLTAVIAWCDFFFFSSRRRHTRYWRDWSSDVCSSDLAVASPKNIAGAERLARDIAHTEREIAYYLDRLDVMDEQMAKGFGDQPAHREAFGAAIASLERRKDRLAKRQVELDQRDEKVLVFGEPEAKPMGYGHAPKLPDYNLQ